MVWAAGDAVGEGAAGDAPGDVVGEGGVVGAGGVGAAGDAVLEGVLCDALVARVLLLMVPACALVSSGGGLVVCWSTGCGGVSCLRCRRLPVVTLMVGWCWRWCC